MNQEVQMTNKTEPIWTEKKIEETVKKQYQRYSKALDDDPKLAFSELLREFCLLQFTVMQLQEAFKANHKVSKGAFDNSHMAVEKYQQLDGIFKTSISSLSKRLEKLEK